MSGASTLSAQSGLWTDNGNYSVGWFDDNYNQDQYAEYHLSSAADLAGLAYLSRTASFKNKKIVLDCDIDLAGHYWRPIGGYDADSYYSPPRFSGVFDGGGHVIKNMKVAIRSSNSFIEDIRLCGGLFASLFGATVQNLTLDSTSSVSVTGYSSLLSSVYGGGFAGEALNTLFVDCHNGASVEVRKEYVDDAEGKGVYVGGIAGELTGSVMNCTNTGAVAGFVDKKNASYSVQAGGIVGRIAEGVSIKGRVAGCENRGTVKAVNLSSEAHSGGITGVGAGEIVRCSNISEITVEGKDNVYAGGIAGYGSDGITECMNSGKIMAKGDNQAYIGGIAGMGDGNGRITYNVNRGEIRSSAIGDANVGGIVGGWYIGAEGSLSYCHNTGDVTSTSSTGESCCGGIVGFNYCPLINCGNNGGIYTFSEGEGPVYAGGVAGMTMYSLRNCYNRGNIEAVSESPASGAVIKAGGITGKIISGFLLNNCYTTADVTVSSPFKAYAGIISTGTFSYRSCYYFSDAVAEGTANISMEGIPLSGSEMKGEDFITRLNAVAAGLRGAVSWEFREGENDGYPVLCKTAAGIENAVSETTGKVYGSKGFLVIQSLRPAEYKVYNVSGVLVSTVHAEAGETRIALPPGLYLVGSRVIRI